MRLNQKRALLALSVPSAVMILSGVWIFSASWFLAAVYRPAGAASAAWESWDKVIQKFTMLVGAFGTFFIPLGIIAAVVFWWLDRQEAKP